MTGNESEKALEELLSEPVTAAEARELIERLTVGQFGDSPQATTLADVVEVTGADAVTTARLLGELRHGAFEERIKAISGGHEARISELEETTERLAKSPPSSAVLGAEEAEVVQRLVREKRFNEAVMPFVYLLLFVLIAFGLMVAFGGSRASSREDARRVSMTTTIEGKEFGVRGDGTYYVVEPGGGERALTDAERDRHKVRLQQLESALAISRQRQGQ